MILKSNYTVAARVYPVFLALLSVLIVSTVYTIQLNSSTQFYFSIGGMGALYFLFSQIGRDRGKRMQEDLWKSWGGPPAIQAFRFRSNLININIKKRYHHKMTTLCPGNFTPSPSLEQADPQGCDEIYEAWVEYLKGKTRDPEKFNLLFQENINYGFRRNTWGLKPFAIILILVCSSVDILVRLNENSFLVLPINTSFFVIQGALLLDLIFWVFIVKKDWIRIPAFAYGERLLEQIDNLS